MATTLSARLEDIAGLVPACRRVVDIGSDHALLPIHLVHAGRCRTSVARDLREGPAAVARRNVLRSGLSDRIVVEVADGLDGLVCGSGDVIVIAGLGGLETADILERGLESAKAADAVVLQPMKSLPELRGFLVSQGFSIEREALSLDAGRFYCALRGSARQGTNGPGVPLDGFERLVGRDLIERRAAHFSEYLRWIRGRLEKECRGLSHSLVEADIEAVRSRRDMIVRIDSLLYTE